MANPSASSTHFEANVMVALGTGMYVTISPTCDQYTFRYPSSGCIPTITLVNAEDTRAPDDEAKEQSRRTSFGECASDAHEDIWPERY
jgi:hypothetical protein